MEIKCKVALGRGLKTWVFTRPDIWEIKTLVFDDSVQKWYVEAHTHGNEHDCVDFFITTRYIQKITGKKYIEPVIS